MRVNGCWSRKLELSKLATVGMCVGRKALQTKSTKAIWSIVDESSGDHTYWVNPDFEDPVPYSSAPAIDDMVSPCDEGNCWWAILSSCLHILHHCIHLSPTTTCPSSPSSSTSSTTSYRSDTATKFTNSVCPGYDGTILATSSMNRVTQILSGWWCLLEEIIFHICTGCG